MDLEEYRASPAELERMGDLMNLLPTDRESVLDIGARDGYLSLMLADRFTKVVALDLEQPTIEKDNITCVRGDVTALEFAVGSIDVVLCAEVLEHIPTQLLPNACLEIQRVAKHEIIIGVPYRQDIRAGQTTCPHCEHTNPPWGHVNVFDEGRLRELFADCSVKKVSFVGWHNRGTNWFSTWLMDLVDNPYGTYDQDEKCVYCGGEIERKGTLGFWTRAVAKVAHTITMIQRRFSAEQPIWIHVRFTKIH